MSQTRIREMWFKLYDMDLTGMLQTGYDGNSYLNWADAWSIFVTHYPASFYTFHDETRHPDGSVMVNCTVRVHLNDEMIHEDYIERSMWLPVMQSGKSKASVVNPTSRQIQDTRMRCLVKCLGMFGLGIKLWRQAEGGMDHSVPSQPVAGEDEERTELTLGGLKDMITSAESKKQIIDCLSANANVTAKLNEQEAQDFRLWCTNEIKKFQ